MVKWELKTKWIWFLGPGSKILQIWLPLMLSPTQLVSHQEPKPPYFRPYWLLQTVVLLNTGLFFPTKANTWEAGADVKESGILSDAGHLEDEELMSQSPSPPLSGGRGFYKEGEGNRTRKREVKEGGWKVLYVQMSTVYSDKANDVHHPGLVILDSCHPCFMSSWLHHWRSANLLELGCLMVRLCIFWS